MAAEFISVSPEDKAITSLHRFTSSYLPSYLHLCPRAHQAVQAAHIASSERALIAHCPRAHVRSLGPPPCARSLGHRTPLPRSTALHFPLSLIVLSGRCHHFRCCVIWENLHPTNSFNRSISRSFPTKPFKQFSVLTLSSFSSPFPGLLQSGVCSTVLWNCSCKSQIGHR